MAKELFRRGSVSILCRISVLMVLRSNAYVSGQTISYLSSCYHHCDLCFYAEGIYDA